MKFRRQKKNKKPVKDKIYVDVNTENMEDIELTLVNLRGEDMLQRKITASRTCIDLSSMPSGIYLLNVCDVSSRMITTKILLIQ